MYKNKIDKENQFSFKRSHFVLLMCVGLIAILAFTVINNQFASADDSLQLFNNTPDYPIDSRNHTNSLKDSLFNMKTWGRPIEGGDNFHFQDNGATAATLYKNIDDFYKQIKMLCLAKYNVDVEEALKFNKHILDLYGKKRNVETFTKNWHSWFFDGEPLKDVNTSVSVKPNVYHSITDHARHLFWYGRKSKRCFLKSTEEIND